MQAFVLARWGCGLFFLAALLTGVWKYACMARSDDATAPVYVDIAHRAAFLYAFACLVLEHFAHWSRWPEAWNLGGVLASILFYGLAWSTYLIHGLLRDTDNQLRRPHRLGPIQLPGALLHGFMFMLIVAEIGGFLVLFTGAMLAPTS